MDPIRRSGLEVEAVARDDAFMDVPHLTTPRLLLRELRVGDFDAYADHMADPVAMKYMNNKVDRRLAWRLFASLTGGWILTKAGWWAIELRETSEFIGTVGAFFRETSLPLDRNSDLELGWSLLQSFWGRGYAKEAAKAALTHGLANHEVRRAIANIDPQNASSIGVSKAIGMTFDGEYEFYGEPSVRYALNRTLT